MLTPTDLIQARTDSGPAAFQQFALLTRSSPDDLFCFFEGAGGADNSYYVSRIRAITKKYQPIRCGGRDAVLRVYTMIKSHSEYDNYKKAFFIDKDFNQPLAIHNPPIFETPYYSIENFYVSEEVFKDILRNIVNVSESDPEFHSYLSLFNERQKEYHSATLLFNSWYACLIDLKNESAQKTGVNLEDQLPKGFISISLDGVSSSYDMTKIKEKFPNALNIENDKLLQKIADFSSCEQYKVFRGKYEMHFLIKFFELLVSDSYGSNKYAKKKIKLFFSSSMTNDQAINTFSMYAETPSILIDYLNAVTK